MRVFSVLAILWFSSGAAAQVITGNGVVGGVAISPDGFLQYRQVAPIAKDPKAAGSLLYVSLPRALAEWKSARESGKDPVTDLRYLHGLTRIQNIFIYASEHDLVLAGPGEPINAASALEPVGSQTGRPLVQLEDLITALRAIHERKEPNRAAASSFFGCSLEPPANFQQVWQPTLDRFGRGPRPQLQQEMKKALGPQGVTLYGVPEDSRIALAMVAADYRLKRMCLGLEPGMPAGIGNALGSANAMPRFWFEPAYEPLLVSPDQTAYEFRGPRLKVLLGAQAFDPTPSTAFNDAQKRFADSLSAKIPEVAARVDAVADLQNITDCFLLAALIDQDKLAQKAHLDLGWLYSDPDHKYATATVPTPRTAETIVQISGNVIAQGGVAISLKSLLSVERSSDKNATFALAPGRPASDWFLARPK